MKPNRPMAVVLVCTFLLGACTQTQTTASPAPPTSAPSTTEAPAPTAAPTPTTLPPTPTPLPYTTPEWFKQAVLYQVFVRSFYDSNDDGIGDLDGITQKLDYLQSLGADTLWLTPIFSTTTYHGYDTVDYYAINPDFGTHQDLIELVEAAHARDMHIILDYVANHMSNENPIFKDAYANPSSQYSDWFLWKDEKHLNYESFFGNAYLPTVNQGNPEARAYFLEVAKYYLDLDSDGDYSDGIDGWRCDYALGPVRSFWVDLRNAVKAVNPEALLLGEVWVDDPSAQETYLENRFDALFDFPLFIALMGGTEQSNDSVLAGQSFVTIPIEKVDDSQRLFPPESIMVRFLNNHDTDRLATELQDTPERLRLAPLLLATLPGTPTVYYGEEIGQLGHKGSGPLYDEYRREPMDWYASATGPGTAHWFNQIKYTQPDDGISVEEQEADPNSLLNHYRAALALRRANPALASGDYVWLPVQPRPGVWAFWRYTDAQIIAAIFNFGLEPATVALDLSTAPGTLADTPVDLLTGEAFEPDPQTLTLEPGQVLVLDWTP